MKKNIFSILFLFITCISFYSCQTNNESTCRSEEMKAIWMSQYDLTPIYTDNKSQRNPEDYTSKAASVINNIKNLGFNTIFLQIRPNADSMYPSDYYPVSEYVTGDYSNDFSYDPVEILVGLAHNAGLSIHAWINPLRAMSSEDIKKIDDSYKIKRWYLQEETHGKYIVEYSGKYYLNPAYKEVRNLITDGAGEALTKYDFDGLHMDDYFYPTTDDYFDKEAYKDYQTGGGRLTLADFRREALSELVSDLYNTTKKINADLLFGISPSGIIDTVYNSQYADVYLWCSRPGYVDYICPQVYFGMEHETYDFISVCNTYSDIIKNPEVGLVVGMSFGKAFSGIDNYAGIGKYEWQKYDDIMARCLTYTKNLEKCMGVSVFCYQYFYDPVTGKKVSETANEVDNFLPVLGDIHWNNTEV